MNPQEIKKLMEVVKRMKELCVYLAALEKDVRSIEKRVTILEATR